MSITTERESRDISRKSSFLSTLDSLYIQYPDLSPRLFGSEDRVSQETLIIDEPLIIPESEYKRLVEIAEAVVSFIDDYPLSESARNIGINSEYLGETLEFDCKAGGDMLHGGLDIYKNSSGEFKILEINSQAQAMGLQDYRLQNLGITNQPLTVQHLSDWVRNSGFKKVLVLGSKHNPFWRAHERVSNILNLLGTSSEYSDTQSFEGIYKSGFTPDMILKFCSARHILYHESSSLLKGVVLSEKIPVFNNLSSVFYGYRGFLEQVAKDLPGFFPEQKAVGMGATDEDLESFPWLKLEVSGFEYVVNYSRSKRWVKDTLLAIINRDFQRVDELTANKTSRDAQKLVSASKIVEKSMEDEVRWLAQEHIDPSTATLSFSGQPTELKILHRVYWVKKTDGGIQVSIEGFGVTKEQFSRSKGKINAGTGISVPMVIK